MPVTSAAKKALRVSQRKREINLKWINKIKDLSKKSKKAIGTKSKEAPRLVAELSQALDKAVQKKIIHKNKAARLKSRLVKSLKAALGKEGQLPKIKKVETHTPKAKKEVKKPVKTKKTVKPIANEPETVKPKEEPKVTKDTSTKP